MDTHKKNKWNYKTSNFFTGFHHIAYLESIKNSYTKPKVLKQNLPKLSYLAKRSTPRYSQYMELRHRRATSQSIEVVTEDRNEPLLKLEETDDNDKNVETTLKTEESEKTLNKEVVKDNNSDVEIKKEISFEGVLRELEIAQKQFQNLVLDISAKNPLEGALKTRKPDANTDVTSSLVESMKAIIVQEKANSIKEGSITWEDLESQSEVSESMAKFPRETKTAMMVLLNRAKAKNRTLERTINKYGVKPAETQTTPSISSTKLNLPCVKNLLCTKGLHSGSCDGDLTPLSSNSKLYDYLNLRFVENA